MNCFDWRLLIPFFAACLCLPSCAGSAEQAKLAPQSADIGSVNIICGTAKNPVAVSTTIPKSPNFPQGSTDDIDGLQCDFDVFSWNSFIALNHGPGGSFGNVDGDNPTLWEGWPESSDIFLPKGAAPPQWQPGKPPPDHEIPPECAAESTGGEVRVLRQIAKIPDILEATDEPFLSGPLIDVNGRYSRFAININQEMYNYILQNELYSEPGQEVFTAAGSTVSFPCSCDADPKAQTCTAQGLEGAIMVKSAWKVLDPEQGDDPSKFHKMKAFIFTPAQRDQPATCSSQLIGLVGFHIAHKTQADVQWLWSTFEHVGNVPTQGEAIPAESKFSYFIPNCTDCNEVNVPPPQPWNPHVQPVPADSDKSQVMRVIPLTSATKQMNAAVQPALLADTVWANYELISTQWPTDASGSAKSDPNPQNSWCNAINPGDMTGAPAPPFLANTTLETYIQGTVPQASSSCINCHLNATMAAGQNSFSDFTYLLERAQ